MPDTVYEHDAIKRRFQRMLARNRLASTYLFVGPEGVGKRLFARRLAAALLCPATPDADFRACGACRSCELLAAGAHPDLLEVAKPEGKSTLPIELFIGDGDHRNRAGLCHEIALKPFLGARRVALIDDADDLGPESANCLLKTLEEPPPRSVLILIGTAAAKQLPTIRSRAQEVRFGPLGEATVARILREQGLVEPDEDAERLAAESGGSVCAALAARDGELRAFRDTLLAQLSAAAFDPVRLAADAVAFASEAGGEAGARRARLAGLIHAAIGLYRRAMFEATGATPPSGAPRMTAETAARCVRLSLDAEASLARNANQATLMQAWLAALWREQRRGA